MIVPFFRETKMSIRYAPVLKKRSIFYLLCLGVIIFTKSTYAFDTHPIDGRGIEVTGQGSIVVTPDRFSLTLTVTERGRVPSKLQALVDKKSNAVISAAKNLNTKMENVVSARVNLRIIEEKPSIQIQGVELTRAKQGSVFIDGQNVNQANTQPINNHNKKPLFELSRQITVHFSHIDEYDDFLTQIIKINVSHISSLSMSVEAKGEFYQQALLEAIENAKNKAQNMAKHAGSNLGALVFVKEVSNNHYRPMYAEAMLSDSSSNNHKSLIGKQTITAQVLVKYSLED